MEIANCIGRVNKLLHLEDMLYFKKMESALMIGVESRIRMTQMALTDLKWVLVENKWCIIMF